MLSLSSFWHKGVHHLSTESYLLLVAFPYMLVTDFVPAVVIELIVLEHQGGAVHKKTPQKTIKRTTLRS